MHLGLMIDASGSMQADMKLAQSAAIKFLNMLPSAEDITLVDFDTQVRITRYPQRDFARLIERIRQRKPEGWTALYDALGTYLDGAGEQEGRKVMVMYTDGGDTRSALRFHETLTLLKASQVTVYAIGLVDNTGSARTQLQMILRQIAETTGGQAFFPTAMKDVEGAYEKVLAEINGQYHLGYVSSNPPPTAPGARWTSNRSAVTCGCAHGRATSPSTNQAGSRRRASTVAAAQVRRRTARSTMVCYACRP
jgi:Ca-activated chloride channel family protein